MVSTRRPTVASRTLAEQLRPVVDAHRAIQDHGYGSTDVERAQTRIRSGRTGFDAWELLEEAGDLSTAFTQMTAAFELSGIASTSSISALESVRADPTITTLRWANAESAPVEATLRLERRIAGVVGNAILSRIARQVMADVSPLAWKRSICPCCGASPDLALQTEARRYLVCWRCDTTWRTSDRGCLGCGETSPPGLVRIPSPYLGYELAICNACGRYLKERKGGMTHEPIVERTLTAGLDEAAQLRGLRN
jgi:Protein involved in formate dehydrogenase formation